MREYEMEIDSLRANVSNARRVVILKQKDADCYIPIWIGTNEAEAIALKLHEFQIARPLTHDLLCEAIERLGGVVSRVVITKIEDETVYAAVVVEQNGKEILIDARPSDAIALAVRTSAPIYALEDIVKNMGENLSDKEEEGKDHLFKANSASTTKSTNRTRPRSGQESHRFYPLGKEERLKLSAFSDFIDSLEGKLPKGGDTPAE